MCMATHMENRFSTHMNSEYSEDMHPITAQACELLINNVDTINAPRTVKGRALSPLTSLVKATDTALAFADSKILEGSDHNRKKFACNTQSGL